MYRRRLAALAVLIALAGTASCSQSGPSRPAVFSESPCPSDVTAVILEEITCGYLTVPERRNRPDGARIRLFVVRIEPPGEPSPDPMIVVGGELGSGNHDYGSLAPMAARTHRRVYLLDQRGTGRSQPNLTCPEVQAQVPTLLGLRQSDPAAQRAFIGAVRECRDRLTADNVDLAAYNLAESAADVADLRLAIGLDEVNLIGTGTGSRIAIETLRSQPDGVRTAVLDSPDLPGHDDLTRAVERTEHALAAVGKACRLAGDCEDLETDLVGALRAAVTRLDATPAMVDVELAGGQLTPVILDGALLLRTVRQLMTSNGGRDVPEVTRLLAHAASGAPITLSPATMFRLATDEGMCIGYVPLCEGRLAHGLYYSLLCHDLLPYATTTETATSRDEPEGYAVAYRRHPYLDVCDLWDVGEAGTEITESVTSDVPVLIEIGEYDPYVRLDEVEQATAGLTNVYIVEVPHHSYNVFGYFECPRNIRRDWLDNPSAPPADTSCLTTEIVDPFH
ncbi:MAG TPA: alpha/beta hydrolase [Jiangellaceae bacterium]|jgi:pimeloyl-ACP methyl ester carboxylesterase|nr:alpha/beta hydrolase [Jiangellaceae bacterium]